MKRSHLKTTKNSILRCPPFLSIQRTLGFIFALLECNSPHILIVLRHYLRHYLGLTRPHHKVLHFLIGSSCSPVSTRATALPAFYFLAAANCLVLPIISAHWVKRSPVPICDLLWPFVAAVIADTAITAVTAADNHAAADNHDLTPLHQIRA